jgi:hypothetical protein
MKNDMKLIMENWRKNTCEFDPIYVQNVLGIQIPLVEGRYVISESLKKDILQEQLILENFFSKIANFVDDKMQSIKHSVFEQFGNFAELFKTMWSVVTNPNKIGMFTRAIGKKGVKPILKKINLLINKLQDFNMPNFAKIIEKQKQKMIKAVSLDGWKGAASSVGITLLWNFAEQKMAEIAGEKINSANPFNKFLENLKTDFVDKIEKFFEREFKNKALKLFGAKAFELSSGAVGWMKTAHDIFKTVSWVAESLLATLKEFQRGEEFLKSRTNKAE